MEMTATDPAFFLSYVVSWLLLLLCALGVYGFYPLRYPRTRDAQAAWWLILAIWMGFLGNGLNVLYWRVIGDFALHFEFMTLDQLRYVGNGLGDTLWKGIATCSVYLHFYARWSALPEDDRGSWHPLTMAFHPTYPKWLMCVVGGYLKNNNRK